MDWLNPDKKDEMKLTRNEHLAITMGMSMFFSSEDDPDDTLFVSMTQRETIALGIGLLMLKAAATRAPGLEAVVETVGNLCNKMADATVAQKMTEEDS